MWSDFIMEINKNKTSASDREMIASLAAIAKKHGVELKWTDYSDRTPDHYNVLRGGWSWKQWNPLNQEVDVYELLLLTGIYWLDISKPLKELCEEIIMYRGEKNV